MEDSGIGIAAAQQAAPVAPTPPKESASSSTQGSPLSQSTDDFTLVGPRAMMSSVSKSQYSQVVFHDVSDVYPTDSDIKCRYTLTSDVSAQPGDKVALFRVGWLSVSEYITFERAPQPTEDGSSLSVTFKAEKLPKDTITLYQLCYVTSGNVIAGASTPFTFHVPTESELIAVEDPADPGMVVFKSRVSHLQEDLQKKNDEYEQLQLKHRLVEENLKVLKKELDKVDASLKHSNDTVAELYTNKQSLEIDNKVLQERLIQFQQETHTIGKLEEELNHVKDEKTSIQSQLSELQSVHEQILRQFEENKKSYLTVKMENLDLVANMSKNYEALQEKTRQVESQMSTIKCLQQDCERTTQALKEQVKVVESLSAHNENLTEKLRQLAAKHNESTLENIELREKCKEAENKVANLEQQNSNLRGAIQEIQEASLSADPSNAHAARARMLEEEKEMLQVMLMTLEEHHGKCNDKINNLTAQLSTLSLNASTATPERRASDQNDPASAIFEVVRNVASNFGVLISSPEEPRARPKPSTSSDSSASGGEERQQAVDDVKTKLKEVREQKSELSSQLVSVRHHVSEMEKQLTELRQDQATKKNRIEVLEIELRAAKEELQKQKKRKQEDGQSSKSDALLVGEHLDALYAGLPVINKFNEQVVVLSLLQEKLESERAENAELKNKIVDLLSKDAEMCGELQELREKYEAAVEQLETLRATPQAETMDMLNRALDHCSAQRNEAESKLQAELEAKAKLEQQVTTLRAESVGKVSVDCSRKMQESINVLEGQVAEMTKFTNYMKKFIHFTFDERANKPINCPLCPTEFPYTCGKKFAAHFKDQHMK